MNVKEIVEKYFFSLDEYSRCDYIKTFGDEEYSIRIVSLDEFYIYIRYLFGDEWVELSFLRSNIVKLIKFLELLED